MTVLRAKFILFFGILTMFFTPVSALSKNEVYQEATTEIDGTRINSLFIPKSRQADLPPIVLIHGASASLTDPVFSFRDQLEGRADLLFVDRPGHGRSQLGRDENLLPDGQADVIAALMKQKGIRKAIIVGHSYGGAVAASFALRHPEMVSGLVFLSPAVYPWPGKLEWYYNAGEKPIVSRLIAAFLAPTVGWLTLDHTVRKVFEPNPVPDDYVAKTRAYRAIRPRDFRNNALEIAKLKPWTERTSPLYRTIEAPAVIITGDIDQIVSPKIHAQQLARDLRHAKLFTIRNMGHKSDYVARDLVVAAIESLSGKKRDLDTIARTIEKKIAGDTSH